MCSHFENYFPPQPKNWHNRTTLLYTKYNVTPKTISRQNQKTNSTPQLYFTLSTKVCKTKTYFLPESKTDTTAQLEKKFLQPMQSKCICFSVHNSIRP